MRIHESTKIISEFVTRNFNDIMISTTSLTSGVRSVSIVRSRTEATEFSLVSN
jgi:hypothetical protein